MATEMGATCSSEVTGQTTHLVAATVQSAKYRAATRPPLEETCTVATEAWVRDCYENTIAYDAKRYALPPLLGLCVCSTNFALGARDALQKRVEEMGATYVGALEKDATTHLVAMEPSGQKFEFAVSWGLPVVHVGWLDACQKAGKCVDTAPYSLVDDAPPAESEAPSSQPSSQPVQTTQARTVQARVDDLTRAVASLEPCRLFAPCRFFVYRDTPRPDDWSAAARACLDLINLGFGAVYPRLFASVSHVVVPPDTLLTRDAKLQFVDHAVVNADWLVESLVARRRFPATDARFAPPCI